MNDPAQSSIREGHSKLEWKKVVLKGENRK